MSNCSLMNLLKFYQSVELMGFFDMFMHLMNLHLLLELRCLMNYLFTSVLIKIFIQCDLPFVSDYIITLVYTIK